MSRLLVLTSVALLALNGANASVILGGDDHDEFVHDIEIHGAGTTNPSKFFWKTLEMFSNRLKVPNFMTYRATGSSTGQKEFVGDYEDKVYGGSDEEHKWEPMNDWGAGDIPFSGSRYALLTQNASREMVHIPFALGAISVFHNIPASALGDGAELDLSPCLLAKIFQGDITTWDHEDILEANPNFSPPAGQAIYMVHRTHGSSSTTGLTEYLHTSTRADRQNCESSWTLSSGSKITWTASTAHAAIGSGGVTAALKANEYSIGYLDAGHGHANGLSEISLLNLHSNEYIKSTEADISVAVGAITTPIFPADSSETFEHVQLYNLENDQAWPITMVTYLYVQKNMSAWDGEKAGLFKAFLEYINDAETGQMGLAEFRFVMLPDNVRAYNNETIQLNITWPESMQEFTFETATTAWIGAGRYVISSLRNGYGAYERGSISDSLETVETTVADLSASSCGCSADDHDHDNTKSIAAAAIALACIAIVLSVASLCFANVRRNEYNGMDQCTPVGKRSQVEMKGTNGSTV